MKIQRRRYTLLVCQTLKSNENFRSQNWLSAIFQRIPYIDCVISIYILCSERKYIKRRPRQVK